MKSAVGIFIAIGLGISVAAAGDAKIEGYMSSGPDAEARTSFSPDDETLYALFKTKGLKNGDELRGVLIAEDVGGAAPENTTVLDKTLAAEGDTEDGNFRFSKPTNGWPIGKYRVEIYVNKDLATTMKFAVKGDKKKKSESDQQ